MANYLYNPIVNMPMLVVGVEEAGRGPVIGPLVMCAVAINEKDEAKLVNLGVKDSKQLTPRQRESLFDKIKRAVKEFSIIMLSPEQIDEALNSPDTNLNWLEADTSIKLIKPLKPDKVILDCPSNNVKAYKSYVKKKLPKIEVIAEHKADENYPVVAAASILAKVTRDREIEKIKAKIGQDFGSGYPADPRTVDFLKENWDKHPEIFRKTWACYKKIAHGKSQTTLGGF